jgi:hypothetical protein
VPAIRFPRPPICGPSPTLEIPLATCLRAISLGRISSSPGRFTRLTMQLLMQLPGLHFILWEVLDSMHMPNVLDEG